MFIKNILLQRQRKKNVDLVIDKIKTKGQPLPGLQNIFNFFYDRSFKIGLATSSPLSVVDAVCSLLGIGDYIKVKTSAEHLEYGKPHPKVYLNCAGELKSSPLECICFEDSVNGMIAVKAARMKCVVVPAPQYLKDERWSIADLKISSLKNFSELHIRML
jgi:sugar-phosphatase